MSTLIRLKDHDGRQLLDAGVLTQTESVYIQPQTLEDGLRSISGRVLLRILKAVDYAGAQRRPVMLLGRKQRNGGMMLHMTTPLTDRRPGPPPELNGHGSLKQNRNGTSVGQSEAFYRT